MQKLPHGGKMKTVVTLLTFILTVSVNILAFTDYKNTMNDFMGVNVHAQLYFSHYLGSNDEYDISKPFRWVRNYHPWGWFEETNDSYEWSFSGEGKWKYFDNYYGKLDQDSVNILISVISPPEWVNGHPHSFHDNGEGKTENNYRESAEYLAQLAARYGPSGSISPELLETSDDIQGLDYCRYFEDSNEPNQWWESEYWHPRNYGAFLNAAHDGYGVQTNEALPIAGVKQGDSEAVHVMGGMAGTGLTPSKKFEGSYLDTALSASGRDADQLFDIINFHQYWNTTDSIPWTGAFGVCPENGIYERGDSSIFKIIEWRNENAPGMPIWFTEFGWDTYTGGGTDHSYQFAPELSQANYIMRSFALLKKEGIDKAFVYFDHDPNSTGTTQYSSSGLVKDEAHNYERKTSFYFMTTMRRTIGSYRFAGADMHAQGDPQVYVYRYTRTPQDLVLMVWCRDPRSIIDNGTELDDFRIDVSGMVSCNQVLPENGLLDGQCSSLEVVDAGTEQSHVSVPVISETPLFLQITTEASTHSTRHSTKIVPSSTPYRIRNRTVAFRHFTENQRISVTRLDGKVEWEHNHSGMSEPAHTFKPGVYLYRIRNGGMVSSGRFLIR